MLDIKILVDAVRTARAIGDAEEIRATETRLVDAVIAEAARTDSGAPWAVVAHPVSCRGREYACADKTGAWSGWTSPGYKSGRATFAGPGEAVLLVRQVRRIYPEAIAIQDRRGKPKVR